MISILFASFFSILSHAALPPLQCSFEQKGNPESQYVTSMDVYGTVVTKGKIGKDPFQCTYQIKQFSYSPNAINPNMTLELKRNQCSSGSELAETTKSYTTLVVQVAGKGFRCEQDLMLHYPLAKDTKPLFDGKQIKALNEKYNRKIWP